MIENLKFGQDYSRMRLVLDNLVMTGRILFWYTGFEPTEGSAAAHGFRVVSEIVFAVSDYQKEIGCPFREVYLFFAVLQQLHALRGSLSSWRRR